MAFISTPTERKASTVGQQIRPLIRLLLQICHAFHVFGQKLQADSQQADQLLGISVGLLAEPSTAMERSER